MLAAIGIVRGASVLDIWHAFPSLLSGTPFWVTLTLLGPILGARRFGAHLALPNTSGPLAIAARVVRLPRLRRGRAVRERQQAASGSAGELYGGPCARRERRGVSRVGAS